MNLEMILGVYFLGCFLNYGFSFGAIQSEKYKNINHEWYKRDLKFSLFMCLFSWLGLITLLISSLIEGEVPFGKFKLY